MVAWFLARCVFLQPGRPARPSRSSPSSRPLIVTPASSSGCRRRHGEASAARDDARPIRGSELPAKFSTMEQTLREEGYLPAGVPALLDKLQAPSAATRARSAARLGWRRSRDAVDPLLAALGTAVDDVCSIIDALGAIGDPRAFRCCAARRPQAPLTAASAVEAREQPRRRRRPRRSTANSAERLPDSVRQALDTNTADTVAAAVLAVDLQQRSLAVDTLYEIGTPTAVTAARAVLRKVQFGQATSGATSRAC